MLGRHAPSGPRADSIYRWLDRGLTRLSAVAFPLVMAVISVVALIFWAPQHASYKPQTLSLRVLEDVTGAWTPVQAAERLAQRSHQNAVAYADTHLSEAPFWFTLAAQPASTGISQVVEFPSRHGRQVACWDADTLQALGTADRDHHSGLMRPARAGFALELGPTVAAQRLLCRASFSGPARLTADQWDAPRLDSARLEFERNAAWLNGGLLVLAIFVFVLAVINRDGVFMLFGAWFVINLRMAALSAGWDTYWLGRVIPTEMLLDMRPVTLALFYVLSVTFFRTLFHQELQALRHKTPLRITQAIGVVLLVCSLVLPYAYFLPLVWVATPIASLVLGFYLLQILSQASSPMAWLYTASITITVLASLYEVISAAFGYKSLIGSVNSVTAALSSSLLAALAIAAQMQHEHRQREQAEAALRHNFEVLPLGLFTLDLQGQFMSMNPALRAMLGREEMPELPLQWQHHFGDYGWRRLLHQTQQRKEVELELDERSDPPQADPRRFAVRASLSQGRIEGSLQDITERTKATARLEFLAHHDPLTGSLNRVGIESALSPALALSGPQERPTDPGIALPLAYLDLDRFKLVNELFGHRAGDAVLQQVAERLRAALGPRMVLGRIAGDVFLIGMPGLTIAQAQLICQDIVDSVGGRPYEVGERLFHVRGTVGLVEVTPGTSFKDAVATADRACQQAKASGSTLVVYEHGSQAFRERELHQQLVAQLSMPEGLQGLYLEMQPIMSLTEPLASKNFEVLLRMRDAEGQTLPTHRVIHAAESSGRMGLIDRWVLSNTMDWIEQNQSRLQQTQFVCMNLSGSSLNDEKFIEYVFDMLSRRPSCARYLCLEITESVALHNLDDTRRVVDQLRQYGAKVALDDFGAGYTSFSYLRDLPCELLKLDGSFVVNMNQHPANIAIVQGIVGLAHNLGMKTIAEWAEDMATVQTLASIGVDYVQGFVVARPMAPEKLLQASSSASFIQDPFLQRYVKTLHTQATL